MDLINWTNVYTPSGFLAVPNAVSAWTWSLILLMIFVVLVLILLHWGVEIALLTALFPTILLSFMMYYAGLIGRGWVVLYFALLIIVVAMVYFTSTRENV